MDYLHHSEFKLLETFDRIAVVGPQRSGTKIVANIICAELGYEFVLHYKMPPNKGGRNKFLNNNNIVLHSPSFFLQTRHLIDTNSAVIFVWRNLEDIQKSIEKYDARRRIKDYDGLYGIPGKGQAEYKQTKWINMCSKLEKTDFIFNVKYEDLEGHSLWIGEEHRKAFSDINQVDMEGNTYTPEGISLWTGANNGSTES